MLDRERVLGKLDALHGYGRELRAVLPHNLDEYAAGVEKRRATERLLQVPVECILDICGLFVAGLRLGLPAEEENLFDRLEEARVLSPVVERRTLDLVLETSDVGPRTVRVKPRTLSVAPRTSNFEH